MRFVRRRELGLEHLADRDVHLEHARVREHPFFFFVFLFLACLAGWLTGWRQVYLFVELN